MKIHEYQAKKLFAQYGLPTDRYILAKTPEEAERAAREIGGRVVIKAQVLVGGRGKAGGVKVAENPVEARTKAKEILALTIKDIPVEKVIVAEAAAIEKEYYLGLVLDRSYQGITLMATAEGGVEIEELASESPEAIVKTTIFPPQPLDEEALGKLWGNIFPDQVLRMQAIEAAKKLVKLFIETDASLAEINPYALVGGNLIALDAKINFDDNAMFRHPSLEQMRNPEEYSLDEAEAMEKNLSFVSLDGDIGCIVNGAGLAMATLDLVKYFGGQPANFLDVGGSSNPEKVYNALNIILRNPKVKAVLINIFGGITRCDDIAKGLLIAQERLTLNVPLVIRLVGTNQKEGRAILEKAGLRVGDNLNDAVKSVIAAAKGTQ